MPVVEYSLGGAATVASATREFTRQLTLAGIEGAAGDVRRLLAGTLGVSGADLLRAPERTLSAAEMNVLIGYLERRRCHEPVSRILGEREFYGRTFSLSPATLDPRPDSETIVATALEVVRGEDWGLQPLRILDVGTGSGCLLLTLLCELPQATGLGTDISEAALVVAAGNAARLGVAQRVSWQLADGLESVSGPFHMLIANPPYVRTSEIDELAPEVRDYDPFAALDGGLDGLAIYRRLMGRMSATVPSGWVVFEVGHDQADAVANLLVSEVPGVEAAGIRIRRDVSGIRRCVAARTRR